MFMKNRHLPVLIFAYGYLRDENEGVRQQVDFGSFAHQNRYGIHVDT